MADPQRVDLSELHPERCAIFDVDGKNMCCKAGGEWDVEKWRIISQPMFFKVNAAGANEEFTCLVCSKSAGADHLTSAKHKEKCERDQQCRMDYRDAIRRGLIPYPTDGVNNRDPIYGSVDHENGQPPAEVGAAPEQQQEKKSVGPGNVARVAGEEIDWDDMKQVLQLEPVDCHGRVIPRSEFEYKGKIDGESLIYMRELYENPQFYEMFVHQGYPAMRCRLCPSIVCMSASHTPNSTKHKKALTYDPMPGEFMVEFNDANLKGGYSVGQLPPCLEPDELIAGKHCSVNMDKRNMDENYRAAFENAHKPPKQLPEWAVPAGMPEKKQRGPEEVADKYAAFNAAGAGASSTKDSGSASSDRNGGVQEVVGMSSKPDEDVVASSKADEDGWGKKDDGWGKKDWWGKPDGGVDNKKDDGWGKQDDGWGKQDNGWGKKDDGAKKDEDFWGKDFWGKKDEGKKDDGGNWGDWSSSSKNDWGSGGWDKW